MRLIPIFQSYFAVTSWRVAGVAVCLLLLIGFALCVFQNKAVFDRTAVGEELGMKVISNHGSQPKQFQLSDKTLLTLDPGSSLYLADDFGKAKREVYPQGSSFFRINHNKDEPVVGFAEKNTTRIVGARFAIRYNASTVEVEVAAGKVLVTKTGVRGSNGKRVVLVANQKVTFDQTND